MSLAIEAALIQRQVKLKAKTKDLKKEAFPYINHIKIGKELGRRKSRKELKDIGYDYSNITRTELIKK